MKGGAGKAVATAAAQIGKPYEWAAEGPDSFDCSGLTMYAWAAAGVSLVHSSQAQYASLPHVARVRSCVREISCSSGARSTTSGSTKAAA